MAKNHGEVSCAMGVFVQAIHRCQAISFPKNPSQKTAELHPTTQALVVGDARIDREILIIQNEFCLHILVLVKWILGLANTESP